MKTTQNLLILFLLSICISITYGQTKVSVPGANKQLFSFKNASVLNTGKWSKIGVTRTGIYTISAAELASMGFSDPLNVKIYGNKPGLLSLYVNQILYDDLTEIACERSASGVTFFAYGPTTWAYNTGTLLFEPIPQAYSNYQHYFVTSNAATGKNIQSFSQPSGTPVATFTEFDDYQYVEPDDTSLIKSGRTWVGDEFNVQTSRNYTFNFNTNLTNNTVRYKLHVFAHSTSTSYFSVTQNGDSVQIPAIIQDPESTYAFEGNSINSLEASGSSVSVQLNYHKTSSTSKGWLNNLIINVKRSLAYPGEQVIFRKIPGSQSDEIIRFTLQNWNSNLQLWEVSDFEQPRQIIPTIQGTNASFQFNSIDSPEFVVFETGDAYSPEFSSAISNQNLHGANVPDLVIITKKIYLDYANKLAILHHEKDDLDVLVAEEEQIFNEFSSGNPDISAYRNFIKYLYDRSLAIGDTMRYVLFWGDISYNNKPDFEEREKHLLSYQNANSTHPISSVFTDDFFGYMEEGEGDFTGNLDLGIGRVPCSNETQAGIALKKIESYYESYGDWRNNITLIADDPDSEFSNQHMDQAESIASFLESQDLDINLQKIYFDAFPQQVTASGERYPDATQTINDRVNQGALIVNYTGHGNEIGLSHERVITTDVIQNWNNQEKLPFFVTATCEFSRMDDHNRTSGGEYVFLNEDGGGIALLTTTRSVYYNSILNSLIYKYAFEQSNGQYHRLGDIIRLSKRFSSSTTETNIKKYCLMGDPALQLVIPELKVFADSINGESISLQTDTFGALSFITVSGYVSSPDGLFLNDYNGVLTTTVFDKKQTEYTLGNEGEDVFPFQIRNSILYKGKASISHGRFKFSFFIPKDISYLAGQGKLSFYATDNQSDGAGTAYFMVGGASDDYLVDNEGPEIKLFMNDTTFKDYGTTHESPRLLAHLFDESGINTVGYGIGHDIMATMDYNQASSLVLNQYYEGDVDSYQSGKVIYPLSNLSEGEHVIVLKVWDIHNNSTVDSIHFIVADSEEFIVETLKNYPNPFSGQTNFYIEHNQADQEIDLIIRIFDTQGNLVKTIIEEVNPSGYSIGPVEWDGRNEFGQPLSSGVYVYQVIIQSTDGASTSKSERLVVLR